jgi:hypothetical protein
MPDVCGDRRRGWPSLLCILAAGHEGDHAAASPADPGGPLVKWRDLDGDDPTLIRLPLLDPPPGRGERPRPRPQLTPEVLAGIRGLVEQVRPTYAEGRKVAELAKQAGDGSPATFRALVRVLESVVEAGESLADVLAGIAGLPERRPPR